MKKLTEADVLERLRQICEKAWDSEHAHSLEDDLYQDALRAIASGQLGAKKLARLVLRATRYKFSRWAA